MSEYQIITNMLSSYLTAAWPFALAHSVLMFFILFFDYRGIKRESHSLLKWPNTDGESTECSRTLDQFVEEARTLGRQGILVPLTDFSDRLDSLVSGLIDGMYSRVNLFLIIGIAGTFFGLFEFAFGAQYILQLQNKEDALPALAGSLSHSLAKTFPVGFMGLVLTIAGQFLVAFPEQQLRNALAKATQRALSMRNELSRSPAQTLETALLPLKDLESTLRNSLEPVIQSFRDQLGETSLRLKDQFGLLENAVSAVEASVLALRQPTEKLADVATTMKDQFTEVRQLNLDSHEQIKTMGTVAANMQRMIELSAHDLREASSGLAKLPEVLELRLQETLRALTDVSSRVWQEKTEQFLRDLQSTSANLIQGTNAASLKAQENLEKAAQGLSQVSINVQSILSSVLKTSMDYMASEVRSHLEELDKVLVEEYPKACQNVREVSVAIERALDATRGTSKDIGQSWEQIRGAIEKWEQVNKEFDSSVQKMSKLNWQEMQSFVRVAGSHLENIERSGQEMLNVARTSANRKGPLRRIWSRIKRDGISE